MTRENILNVIETEIKPIMKFHNGSCELIDFDDGVITLKIFGGCSGCPSSQIALFNQVVPILMEKVPGVEDVILG